MEHSLIYFDLHQKSGKTNKKNRKSSCVCAHNVLLLQRVRENTSFHRLVV